MMAMQVLRMAYIIRYVIDFSCSDGNVCIRNVDQLCHSLLSYTVMEIGDEKGLHRLAMSLIIAANTDGKVSMKNGFYRSAIRSLIIAADSECNSGKRIASIDHLCHWLKLLSVKAMQVLGMAYINQLDNL